MKISYFIPMLFFGGVLCNANAADITIYYSPTCPHCHHAKDFIENTLIYEYETLKVEEVDLSSSDLAPREEFINVIYKCGYKTGGVPVIKIGEKCFQGYADSMQGEFRSAIESDLTDSQKQKALQNRSDMEKNKDAFISSHQDRKNAVTEKVFQKKNKQ